MKKRSLITGASGFLGANLVRKLLEKRGEIHLLLRKDSNIWRIKKILSRVNPHIIDYENLDSLSKLVNSIKPNYIFNFAAYGSYPQQDDLLSSVKVNIHFVVSLLEIIKKMDFEIFIHTGSSSEYGFKQTAMKETDLLSPVSYYAATKAGMSLISLVYAKINHKPITIVRPFSVYGPFEEKTRLVPTVIMKCLKNEPVYLTQGDNKRDFIYTEDFIDGVLQIAQNPTIGQGKIFNLGTGIQTTIREIVLLIHKLTNSKSPLLWGTYPERTWDTNSWQADISLVKKVYRWKPNFSLKEGLRETILWFKNNLHYYADKI